MKNVRIMDATGAHALEKFIESCHDKGIMIIFSGMRERVKKVFKDFKAGRFLKNARVGDDANAAGQYGFEQHQHFRASAGLIQPPATLAMPGSVRGAIRSLRGRQAGA